MKRLSFLLLHLCFLTASAQTIIVEEDQFGLAFPSGKAALPTEYQLVENVRHAYNDQVYICKKDDLFGIYNFADSSFTGCVYDSIYTDYQNTVFIYDNNKMGFLGFDVNTDRCKLIEPLYDEVDVMDGDLREFNSSWNVINILRGANVRIDSLWGVVYFKDGQPWIDIKYHHRIEKSDDGPFFTCVNRNTSRQIIINPYTQAEFETGFLADILFYAEWNLIFTVDNCIWSNGTMLARACRYDTGTEVWSYQSDAADVELTVYSQQLIVVREEFDTKTKSDKTYEYTFWNITNYNKLFTCSTSGEHHIEIDNNENHIGIYDYPHYNSSRPKLLKEIYK